MQETQETWVQSLRQEDTLEEEMATHSTIPAWRRLVGYNPKGWKPYMSKYVYINVCVCVCVCVCNIHIYNL